MGLEYSVAYHLHCQIAHRSGRTLTLQALDQRMTYAGWLEGVPSREWNDQIIEGRLKDAEAGIEGWTRPVLIEPTRRDYLRKPGDMVGTRSMRGRVPEWLPMVACAAVLLDMTPVRDPNKYGSTLRVVWFQDEYALPIAESVLQQLQSIDWERSAADFEF